MKPLAAFTALVSVFAFLEPTVAAPITDATLKAFLASLKLNDTVINKIKQFRGTQMACGVLETLKSQQLETQADGGYEEERTAHW
jgi:hypothetical protein